MKAWPAKLALAGFGQPLPDRYNVTKDVVAQELPFVTAAAIRKDFAENCHPEGPRSLHDPG